MKYTSKGALHLHTIYSDGTGTIPEIAKAAKKAGLDWIIITDHNNLKGREAGEEGWYDGVAVIVEEEITPDGKDHYLALGINETIPGNISPQESIDTVKKQGGFGFVAHPDEKPERQNKQRALRWSDWNLRGFDGIEIWNYLSDWTDNFDEKRKIYCFLNRHKIVKGPSNEVLCWWDKINNETPEIISAIGGLDSHAFDYKIVKIFPYYDSFKTITNYITHEEKLSSDFTTAKQQVLKALKQGNNTIVNRFWSKGKDNYNFCIKNENEQALVGEKIGLIPATKLIIEMPFEAKIKVIHNGNMILEKDAKSIELSELSAGKYRFEAYIKNRPWIFSNPIICE